MDHILRNYEIAKEIYGEYGVDCDEAIRIARETPLSVHCWQIDDLTGFENFDAVLSGGIAATGNAAGKPKSKKEYFQNLDEALRYIPGELKLALHAVYLDCDTQVARNALEPCHFAKWVDYAKEKKIGLDFNPTYFSHEKAAEGFTLSSADESIRGYWIEHGKRCREIGAYFGKELGKRCVTNHWIPDGYKDTTADKLSPRLRLKDSLDQMFQKKLDNAYHVDSVEGKLFGLGSESYVVGSHDFYSNYVQERNNCILCMDAGHYHPTESIGQKISAYLAFDRELMLHISRPVRWDSDHVVTFDEATKEIMGEVVRCNGLKKVNIGLDFFDASINRIAATVIGARNCRKALLYALTEPNERIIAAEAEGNLTKRLALQEDAKTLPFGFVWDMLCEQENVAASDWLNGLA